MEDTDDDSLEGSNIEENETSQSSKSGDDYSQGTDSGEEHEDDRASEAHGHYNMDALKDSLNEMSTKYDNLAKSFDDMGKDVNDIKGRDVNAFGAKLKEYHKTTAAENQVLNERLDRMKEKHDNFVISTAELTITDTNLLNLINGQTLVINSLQEKAICQKQLHESLEATNLRLIKDVQDRVDGLVGTADNFVQDTEMRLDKAAVDIEDMFTDFLQNDLSHHLTIRCQTAEGKLLLLPY